MDMDKIEVILGQDLICFPANREGIQDRHEHGDSLPDAGLVEVGVASAVKDDFMAGGGQTSFFHSNNGICAAAVSDKIIAEKDSQAGNPFKNYLGHDAADFAVSARRRRRGKACTSCHRLAQSENRTQS